MLFMDLLVCLNVVGLPDSPLLIIFSELGLFVGRLVVIERSHFEKMTACPSLLGLFAMKY